MENQEVTQDQVEDNSNWSFVSDEEAAAAMSDEPAEESPQPVEEQPQQEVETQQPSEPEASEFDAVLGGEITEQEQSEDQQGDGYSQDDMDNAVKAYLSDRFGMDIESLDDLGKAGPTKMDERIQAIADFVAETGRSPQDWFTYQSLDPSGMDDITAIQVMYATEYPNLSHEEITTLLQDKYKIDENLYTEEEIRLSKLQLKIDADDARSTVEEYRSKYSAPENQQTDYDEAYLGQMKEWTDGMYNNIADLQGVEFDLGNGQSFKFGLSNQYKDTLFQKNSNIENYFDSYILKDGSFDYDTFNVHRSIVDNIDSVVQSIYKQGLADGQRGLVSQAANVQAKTPNQGGVQQQEDILTAQLREALGGSSWSF